jgi:microcystin-dependent protein
MAEIPEIPIDTIDEPDSTDLTDEDNLYPLLDPIQGEPSPDSVGPEAGNRQPRALDLRTETLREAVNDLISVVNSLNDNLLHRDGASATVAGSPSSSYMRGDLDMGDDPLAPVFHKVINMADGVDPEDGVNKQQLDAVQAFLNGLQNQLNGALKTDGSNTMLAALNMGAQQIQFMAEPINVADAVTKNYLDTEVATINTTYVKRDGTNPMIGNLDMGGFKVINLSSAVPTSDGDGVSRGYLLQVLSDIAATPPAAIVPYAGLTAPTGWLLCDGSTVSQTTFANLYAVVGTTYNTGGEPGGDFRLPDLRGRIPLGLDNMGGASAGVVTDAQADILGGTLGAEDHTLVTGELPLHSHQYDDQYIAVSTGGAEVGPSVTNATSTFVEETGRTTTSTGGGGAHANVQPVIAMNYIIKI